LRFLLGAYFVQRTFHTRFVDDLFVSVVEFLMFDATFSVVSSIVLYCSTYDAT